ncbi:MAG: metallophosphoesterase family protein [Acidobacteriota bacterium]
MEEVARTLVVGDIHGKLALFNQLLDEMQYRPERDRLVLIGDLVDRGEDSRGVVERAIALKEAAPERVTVLRGNHEDMMLDWIKDPEGPQAELWYYNGGIETLRSYATEARQFALPVYHYDFLNSLPTWHEDEHAIYVHAALPEGENGEFLHPEAHAESSELLWSRNKHFFAEYKGKTVVFGHTIVGLYFGEREKVWINGDLSGVDTGAYLFGVLSAVELPSRVVFSVREQSEEAESARNAGDLLLGGGRYLD